MGLGTGAAVGGVSSLIGGAIGSNGAQKAANAQSQAAQQGINTIQQNQQSTLGSLKDIYGGANQNLQPYQQAGVTALGNLSNAYNNPTVNNTGAVNATNAGEQWGQAFQAPTANQAAQTPGYQFEQQAGQNALLNNASALGNLRSGSMAKGLLNYSDNLASANYQNAYNNALNQYTTNFNAFQQNRGNLATGLGGLASGGLSAAGTLGSLASAQGGQIANTNMSSASDIANLYGNKGAATASATSHLWKLSVLRKKRTKNSMVNSVTTTSQISVEDLAVSRAVPRSISQNVAGMLQISIFGIQ